MVYVSKNRMRKFSLRSKKRAGGSTKKCRVMGIIEFHMCETEENQENTFIFVYT